MRILTLTFLALMLIAAPLSARPGNDPNAAVRYLNAIGHLPAVSNEFLDRFSTVEKLEEMEKLSSETVSFLHDEKLKSSMKLLQRGAACPQCNFTPDDRQHFEDFIPPYRRIRQLARVGRAYAWMQEKSGDANGAFDTLTSIFMMGQHLEENGLLISTMLGVAIRKIAVNALIDFRARHPEDVWKTRLAEFFKRIPNPAVNLKASVEYERTGLENTLRDAKKHPEKLRDLSMEIDLPISANATALPDSFKACYANQRVLRGALEMLIMDYKQPLPATITNDLLTNLVKLQYLKALVSCPESGKYDLTGLDTDSPLSSCSVHGNPDTPSDAADSNEKKRKAAAVEYLTKLVATPDYDREIDECMKMYDELLAIDPKAADFATKCDDIQSRISSSKNIFIQNGMPNLKKTHQTVLELQEKIEQLLK